MAARFLEGNLGNQKSEQLPQQVALTAFRTQVSACVRAMVVTNPRLSLVM